MELRSTTLLTLVPLAALAGLPPLPVAGADKKPEAQAGKAAPKASFTGDILPFVKKYCISCHGDRKPKGRLSLTKFQAPDSLDKDRQVWDKVWRKVQAREMPPSYRRLRPSQPEIERISGFLEDELGRVDCTLPRDPGRVTIRRLNRVEYYNTVRDLAGIKFQPADDFPADDVGYGFDNIGDVLSMPTLLMEKYLAAAEAIGEAAFKNPETRRRILSPGAGATTPAAARQILERFAGLAFRRPVTPGELDRLVGFVELAKKNGDSFETGIQLGLQAILVSPHFLFRVEIDREPNNPKAVHPVSDYELATRLSYFLWSSMPDEQLFGEAKQGTLRKNLEAQVRRMLKDPRAHALVDNFGGQWLQTRNLKTAAPDPNMFPTFTNELRADMLRETEMFFEAVVREDRSILDFLDADFTFLNERLARHYGIDGVKGDQLRRVRLTDGRRGGVLTQASILTITSNPTRTSPVKRGKWILENILGTPPPPPPPDAGELSDDKNAILSGSLRQRMEKHRRNPSCASCHQRMDPLGFGFENFDAIGAWRTKDGEFTIDPSGVLPGGKSFRGPSELKAILKSRDKEFARCLTEKMLTYALGRGLEYYDKCVLDEIAADLAKKQYRFSSLVIDIVKSDPFQKRRGKRGKK
jgi:hypothetical protein